MTRPAPARATDPPDATVVAELERVELAARGRRLNAQAEADRLLAEASGAVAAIESGVEARVEAALAALRDGYLARATADVAAVADELARPDDPSSADPAAAPGFEAAVARLVDAVLAEPT